MAPQSVSSMEYPRNGAGQRYETGACCREICRSPRIRVQEPRRALMMLCLLVAGVAAMLGLLSVELPGIPAAGWRAAVTPYHPTNLRSGKPTSHVNYAHTRPTPIDAAREMGVALGSSMTGRAHARSR